MAEIDEEGMDMTDIAVLYSEAFDKLCQERHLKGQQEYGVFTFLENDVVRMMAEELADVANYCRYHFIKLMMLQRVLEGQLSDKTDGEGNISIGMEAFRGAGMVGW